MSARSPSLLLARRAIASGALAAAVVALSGCAARADRFAAFRDTAPSPAAREVRLGPREVAAAPPDVRRGEMTGRGGFATFGSRVRLRDDTPSLTQVIEAERHAVALDRKAEGFAAESEGPSGPRGWDGGCATAPYVIEQPILVSPVFVGPAGYGPFGAVPHGWRPPSGFGVPAPVFTAPRGAAPDADTWRHRPGLSTGSGIYARPGSR